MEVSLKMVDLTGFLGQERTKERKGEVGVWKEPVGNGPLPRPCRGERCEVGVWKESVGTVLSPGPIEERDVRWAFGRSPLGQSSPPAL